MARILLVHPLFLAHNAQEEASGSPYFPLGLLSLAAYLRDNGHEVSVFDGTFLDGPDDFAAALDRTPVDLVGISAVRPNRPMVLTLAGIASSAGFPVLIGGPDPTADPGVYVRNPSVDLVVHHEGEQTMQRLLDLVDEGALTVDRIRSEPGVAFRFDGKVVVNEPRPPIENLDELPFPARDLVDMERYLAAWDEAAGYRSVTFSTSRGCPYDCQWCADSVHGHGVRRRSPESVAAELAEVTATYAVDRLRMVDDVDAIDRSWLEEWAALSGETAVPFEALNELERQDIPLLDVQDSL